MNSFLRGFLKEAIRGVDVVEAARKRLLRGKPIETPLPKETEMALQAIKKTYPGELKKKGPGRIHSRLLIAATQKATKKTSVG